MENAEVNRFLADLGKAVNPLGVSINMQPTYNQFPQIIENLKERSDFPLEEGNTSNLWNHLAEFCFRASLIDPSFKELSTIAYEEWYEAMLRLESAKAKRTLHKGMPLHQLGVLSLNNKDLAKRYFLLAFIEDTQEFLLGHRDSYIQPSYRTLNGQFRVSSVELEFLKATVEKFKEEKYPEKILMEFLLDKKAYHEIALPQPSLKLNTLYLQDLLNKAVNAKTSTERGNNFTRLVAYLFSTVGGFEVIAENSLTKTGEHDYDLLIRNLVTDNPVFLNFGDYIVAECKFVEKSSGVDVLSHLLYKLRYHECKCGILFAKKGVSFGEANLTIKKAFNRDSTLILVIEESDLTAITKGEKTLLGVLLEAYHSVRFEV